MTADQEPTGSTSELQHDSRVGQYDLTHWYTPLGRSTARLFTDAGRRVGAHPALALILAAGIGAAVLTSFLVSRVYDAVTERDGIAALDVPLLHAAMALRSTGVDAFSAAVAYLFGPIGMPAMAVAAILVLSLRRRSLTPLILIAASGIGSLLMTVAGKDIIGRHRPPLADAIAPFEFSPSFPSGHTLNATVIAGVVGYLLWLRRHTIAARVVSIAAPVLIAIVVGLTRVLLGAHWFTDVLAGWLLGAAWLAVVVTTHRLYLTARRRGAPPKRDPGELSAPRRGAPR
jgi:membrane-associated phospholipid phosphatase